jgi:DNA-binding response OmpR family regulator
MSDEAARRFEARTPAEKVVLLVVEDHGTLREMVSLFLMRCGYQVRTASNGVIALEILAREEIHMVLLDLMLPRVDGFALLRQIHTSRQEMLPYIIVVSVGASDHDRRKVLDLGANEYLPKPFQLARLLERVQAVEKYLL